MQLNNTYYVLRHGEALSNKRDIVSSWPETFDNPLTEKGKLQIKEAGQALKEMCIQNGKTLDMIFSSDVGRAKQTAEIIAKEFNVRIVYDSRLREISFGVMNGGSIADLDRAFAKEGQRFKEKVEGGESYEEILRRVSEFLKDIDGKYEDKTILIVSHQCPLWILEGFAKGWTLEDSFRNIPHEARLRNGEVKKIP